ncbi:hypothetical protein CC80DRAFT_591125 [Byssothecium circinans]|uniref:Uncharacterized protein n=1 Tax=Byssothecium circinans TaxID=147558 RepID=A0A6A5U3Y4_9PLEO|nr:hypothetical protein CC80DRAFT_591125 [Byssothecium circinans]
MGEERRAIVTSEIIRSKESLDFARAVAYAEFNVLDFIEDEETAEELVAARENLDALILERDQLECEDDAYPLVRQAKRNSVLLAHAKEKKALAKQVTDLQLEADCLRSQLQNAESHNASLQQQLQARDFEYDALADRHTAVKNDAPTATRVTTDLREALNELASVIEGADAHNEHHEAASAKDLKTLAGTQGLRAMAVAFKDLEASLKEAGGMEQLKAACSRGLAVNQVWTEAGGLEAIQAACSRDPAVDKRLDALLEDAGEIGYLEAVCSRDISVRKLLKDCGSLENLAAASSRGKAVEQLWKDAGDLDGLAKRVEFYDRVAPWLTEDNTVKVDDAINAIDAMLDAIGNGALNHLRQVLEEVDAVGALDAFRKDVPGDYLALTRYVLYVYAKERAVADNNKCMHAIIEGKDKLLEKSALSLTGMEQSRNLWMERCLTLQKRGVLAMDHLATIDTLKKFISGE